MMSAAPEVVECKTINDLPKEVNLYFYTGHTLATAMALHAARGRAMPAKVYRVGVKLYFPQAEKPG